MALVNYSVADGVAHIELNRPEAANAVDLPTSREFGAAVTAAETDDAVRVVLVTGAGKRFCAGGDVASMVAAGTDPASQTAYLQELADDLDGHFQRLAALAKPVVGAVQGAVAGAGVGLALSCDLVVAQAGTKFVFAYPGVGLTPDCGVSWLLPRAVGQHRALQFALLGRPLVAEEAREWGLATEVVEDAGTRAREIAVTLAAGPAQALGQARRLLRASATSTRAEAGAEEARTIAAAVTGDEAQALLEAFTSR